MPKKMPKKKKATAAFKIKTEPVKTLRDEFAMAALTGLLAMGADGGWSAEPGAYAKRAYAYADAMLAARESAS
jgi:hypothetical protein